IAKKRSSRWLGKPAAVLLKGDEMMTKTLRGMAGLAAVTAVLISIGSQGSAGEIPKRLVFSSYDFGSSGFAQASGIANAFKKVHGTRIRILPSGTSIGRILPLSQRKVDYAFLASGTYFASEGTYDFATPNWGPQNLRYILSPPAATGIATLGNSKFSDATKIKGIRIGYVKGNPSVNVKADAIAAFAGLKEGEWERVWHGGYGVMKTSLLTGKIDAFLASPYSGFSKEIEASPSGIAWLQFDPTLDANWVAMTKIAPMYGKMRLESGAGASKEKPSNTLSFRYPMMVTYADRPDDEVYTIVKAMDELYPHYKDVSFAALNWKLERSATTPCEAAFHPASVKYFKEKGVWTDEEQAWQDARLARHEAVLDAWDDAQDSYNKMRADERAKGNKIKAGVGWEDWWKKAHEERGLD
ncbi:MAG: TAXI family TRAP transporter solute-binding subunit, partial [Alphaproteobacteria bacterium]|nr:TAXI family TRAP transporter solute-binding subunit [Alphaproteobacteria bacterium]